MVYLSRRTNAQQGKIQDALKWAKEMAEYINNKYETNFGVYFQRLGDNPIGTIYWVANLKSMAKYLELVDQLNADEVYLERVANAVSLFIGGTTFDSILEKV
ncbi:MAG: hypothetical protein ACW99A_15025 [Candidatus Kariarchaeaceae archaeon]|jgi:hypothetical protein